MASASRVIASSTSFRGRLHLLCRLPPRAPEGRAIAPRSSIPIFLNVSTAFLAIFIQLNIIEQLGDLYFDQGNYDAARKFYEDYIKI
ncbi:MAG: hypothetical protein B6U94_06115, partial [Thermofilum sp. ex4484_79]